MQTDKGGLSLQAKPELEQLIRDNVGLVYTVLNKHFPQYRKDEDYIQAGMIGLALAAKFYEKSRGPFSTYAFRSIRNEIWKAWRADHAEKNRLERRNLPLELVETAGRPETSVEEECLGRAHAAHTLERIRQADRRTAAILARRMRGESCQEIADRFGITRQRVSALCRRARKYLE